MRAAKLQLTTSTPLIASSSHAIQPAPVRASGRRLPELLALLAAFVICTCIAACGKSGVEQTGIRIGDKTLDQIKKGKTTEDWLRSVLGPPTSESPIASIEKTSVLRYTTVEKSSGLSSLFSGSSSRSVATVYFIVTDGVVTNYWADREAQHSLFGGSSEKQSGEKEQS